MDELIYNALYKYYNGLEKLGQLPYKQSQKLVILSFIKDFILKECTDYITEADYKQLELSLNCLFGSECSIPYPDYYREGRVDLEAQSKDESDAYKWKVSTYAYWNPAYRVFTVEDPSQYFSLNNFLDALNGYGGNVSLVISGGTDSVSLFPAQGPETFSLKEITFNRPFTGGFGYATAHSYETIDLNFDATTTSLDLLLDYNNIKHIIYRKLTDAPQYPSQYWGVDLSTFKIFVPDNLVNRVKQEWHLNDNNIKGLSTLPIYFPNKVNR